MTLSPRSFDSYTSLTPPMIRRDPSWELSLIGVTNWQLPPFPVRIGVPLTVFRPTPTAPPQIPKTQARRENPPSRCVLQKRTARVGTVKSSMAPAPAPRVP